MSYFEEIILPSTNMLKKLFYSLEEAMEILDVSKRSVQRLGRKGRLKIVEGQITGKEFEKFFK